MENKWIHVFPESTSMKWNANSLVQDLNRGLWIHFLTGIKPLCYAPPLLSILDIIYWKLMTKKITVINIIVQIIICNHWCLTTNKTIFLDEALSIIIKLASFFFVFFLIFKNHNSIRLSFQWHIRDNNKW